MKRVKIQQYLISINMFFWRIILFQISLIFTMTEFLQLLLFMSLLFSNRFYRVKQQHTYKASKEQIVSTFIVSVNYFCNLSIYAGVLTIFSVKRLIYNPAHLASEYWLLHPIIRRFLVVLLAIIDLRQNVLEPQQQATPATPTCILSQKVIEEEAPSSLKMQLPHQEMESHLCHSRTMQMQMERVVMLIRSYQ